MITTELNRRIEDEDALLDALGFSEELSPLDEIDNEDGYLFLHEDDEDYQDVENDPDYEEDWGQDDDDWSME